MDRLKNLERYKKAVEKAVEKAGGNTDAAVRRLEMIISADPSLANAWQDAINHQFLEEVAEQVINSHPELAFELDALVKSTSRKAKKLSNLMKKNPTCTCHKGQTSTLARAGLILGMGLSQ